MEASRAVALHDPRCFFSEVSQMHAHLLPSPTPVLLADIINQSGLPFPLSLDSALPPSARQPL